MVIPNEVGAVPEKEDVKDVVEKDGHVIARRKRHRTDDGVSKVPPRDDEPAGYGGVNRMITLLGGNRAIITPTTNTRSSKEVVGVSIRPQQRWVGGAMVPLRAFQIFNFPQDASAYAGLARANLADMCLSRAGRVLF